LDHIGCALVLELTVNVSFEMKNFATQQDGDAPKGLVDNPHGFQYSLIDATNIFKEMITKRK
jgi:hypothetical protein